MSQPLCVVTGANAGVGRACAEQLAGRQNEVVLVCRDRERGEQAQSEIEEATHNRPKLMIADLASQAAVRELADGVLSQHDRLDVLINNAAIFDVSRKTPTITDDDVEEIWAVNHLAPFLLTNLLAERLATSKGRVINVSSHGLVAKPFLKLDFDDLDSRENFSVETAYYRSKLAQCAFTVLFQERHPAVATNIIRVTNVAVPDERLPEVSNLWRTVYKVKRQFALAPSQMAEVYVWAALDDRAGTLRGQHIDHRKRTVNHPTTIRDDALLDELWSRSAIATRLGS